MVSRSAVELLAEVGARELRAATRKLLRRQRELMEQLEEMANRWHQAHCRNTHIGSYRTCYHAVCERNRKAMGGAVFVNESERGPQ